MFLLRPEANIYLDRLQKNYQFIQSMVGSAKVMAVVKADAYGHGAIPIAESLSDAGVYGFCVSLTSEIRDLIYANIKNPILHLGAISSDALDVYESGQARCTINSIQDIKILENHGCQHNIRIIAHLKVDTGMGRLGVHYDDLYKILLALSECRYIDIEGVYSHFSTAEEKNIEYRDWQLIRFKKVIAMTEKILPDIKYRHLANSAAVLTCPESHFNMVRPGISLYGVTPLCEPNEHLLPVMKMKAPVAIIKDFNITGSQNHNSGSSWHSAYNIPGRCKVI